MTPGPGIEPGPHWWEASALTTAPSQAFLTICTGPEIVVDCEHLILQQCEMIEKGGIQSAEAQSPTPPSILPLIYINRDSSQGSFNV